VKDFQQRHCLDGRVGRPREEEQKCSDGDGQLNVVQQLREARPEEPEPPPTLAVRFLAFVMSWTTKSRRRGGRRRPETPGYSSRARPWNKLKKKKKFRSKHKKMA
jgi:hypothetical protein